MPLQARWSVQSLVSWSPGVFQLRPARISVGFFPSNRNESQRIASGRIPFWRTKRLQISSLFFACFLELSFSLLEAQVDLQKPPKSSSGGLFLAILSLKLFLCRFSYDKSKRLMFFRRNAYIANPIPTCKSWDGMHFCNISVKHHNMLFPLPKCCPDSIQNSTDPLDFGGHFLSQFSFILECLLVHQKSGFFFSKNL